MSIRTKVLILTFVVILVVTLFGVFTVSWVTFSQYRELAQSQMESDIRQLALELDLLAEGIKTALLMEIRDRDIINDSKEANEYKNNIPDLYVKEAIVNRVIQRLHATIRNQKLDFAAYYGPQSLYGYTSPHQIYLTLKENDEKISHYTPTGPSSFIRFSKDLWKKVDQQLNVPLQISPPSIPYVTLSNQKGRLILEAGGSIFSEIFDESSNEYREIIQGVVVLQKNISNALFRSYCQKIGVTADLFTSEGQLMVGSYTGSGAQIRDIIRQMNKDYEFHTGIYVDEQQYYVLIKPYYFQNQPLFKIAAYMPQSVVYHHIRHVIYIHLLGLIVGLIAAMLITLLAERFISKPIVFIAQQMQRIAAIKKYDQRIVIDSKDEIGTLAATFNNMVTMLDERNEEIEQYIKQLSSINNRLEISEKQYRSLYENAIEGIAQITPEWQIMSANPSFAHILQYESPDELTVSGVNIYKNFMVKPEDSVHIREAIRRTGFMANYETQLKRKDLSLIWVSVSVRGVYTDSGNLDYYEVALVDVTVRKEKEQAEREKLEAESASKSKSEFLANMSHEIRTPLNAILGFTAILSNKLTDPVLQNYCSSIHFSGKVLLNLIDDILDLSKIEAGKLKIQMEPSNIRTIVSEIENMFLENFRLKGIDFIVEIDDSLPKLLMLDQLRTGQILSNLISNALKFTAYGYVRLRIYSNTKQTENMKTDIVFEIEDTGIGIPYSQHEHIFESFRQQEGQKNRKYGGVGLGLAITKNLVEMMNGEISVYSEVAKGSIFHVYLSQIEYIDHALELDQHTDSSSLTEIVFYPATILIVDDIALDRQLIKEYVGNELTIIEANSAEESLDILTANINSPQNQISLILMDLKLPGISGLEASKIIRSTDIFSHIPIIAMTASSLNRQEFNNDFPFQGYLHKPIYKQNLLAELKVFLSYTEITPESTSLNPLTSPTPAVFSKEDLSRLPPLLEQLENPIMNKWKEIRSAYFIDDISDFASQIKKISCDYHIELLTNYAQKLYNAADNNNIDKIEQYVEEYPEIITSLKSMIEEQDQ